MDVSTIFPQPLPPIDISISYKYYQSHSTTDPATHSIPKEPILDLLHLNNSILTRQDIIDLLKNDGANFQPDSLRILNPSDNSYYQLPKGWQINISHESSQKYHLSFWIIPSQQQDSLQIDVNMLKMELANLSQKFKTDLDEVKFFLQNLTDFKNPSQSQLSFNRVTSIDPLESSINFDLAKVDIAFMYSEPLVRRTNLGVFSAQDPVNFQEECKKNLEILKKKQRKVNAYFEIATVGHLVEVLSMSPKILHIMCHGDFNKDRNMFYLHFENEHGELEEVYADQLRDIIKRVNFETKLVFVNACHSLEVAKVFTDAGVPCVIAIQSELKISEDIALKFSESFYWQLFMGKSIDEAFKNAQASALTLGDAHTCCCGHKHKADCEWYKLVKDPEVGLEKAHYMHTPKCRCGQKSKNVFLHEDDCSWAQEFLIEYSSHMELCEGRVCCCSPELAHNESLKFQKIMLNEDIGKQILFPHMKKGDISIESTYSLLKRRFPIQKIHGRNEEMFAVSNFLRSETKRILNIYGNPGIGKTTLAKLTANYMFERGFFKDRISLIMLQQVSTSNYFRYSLFKEISEANSIDMFCEAIGEKSMLFILDTADILIDAASKDLQKDLAQIIDRNRNVKFIIITREKKEFASIESCLEFLELKNLQKIDAAKLLVKQAWDDLELDCRDIYRLAENDIFDLIPLTPQSIWSIAQQTKGDGLNTIKNKLLMKKKTQQEVSDANKLQEERTKGTLENICEKQPEVYKLIILLCLFPAGLSYQDLEELASHKKISTNWAQILYDFLEISKQNPESANHDDPLKKITRKDFISNTYIWINVNKDPIDEEVWFVPSEFLTNYIEKNLAKNQEIAQQYLKMLEYMALLSTGIIEKAKANYDYIENILECSAISTYGIWKSHQIKETNRLQYLRNHGFSFKRLKALFDHHEVNFFNCLKLANLLQIQQNPAIDLEVIEILCLAIPTLFKLMSSNEEGIEEVAKRADKVAEKFEEYLGVENNTNFLAMRAKLGLFLAVLHMSSQTEFPKNISFVKINLRVAHDQHLKMKDSDLKKAVSSEIIFAEAFLHHRILKYNEKLPSSVENKQSSPGSTKKREVQEIFKSLKNAKELLPSSDKNYHISQAKIILEEGILALMKIKPQGWSAEKHEKDMKKALEALSRYGSLRLIMKAHYLYANILLEINKKEIEILNTECQPENFIKITQITKDLLNYKNTHLINRALKIAKKIRNSTYSSKIKRKIEEFNETIRGTFFNSIIILQSSPLVENSHSEIVPIGHPTRLETSFKTDVLQTLEAHEKIISLRFEVLTKESLQDSLENGCRILQLTCSHVEKDALCLQDHLGSIKRIPLKDLKNIFAPRATFAGSMANYYSITNSTNFNNNDLMSSHMFTSGGNIKDSAFVQKNFELRGESLGDSSSLIRVSSILGSQAVAQQETRLFDVLILAMEYEESIAKLFIELKVPHIIAFKFNKPHDSSFRVKIYQEVYMEYFCMNFYNELVLQKSILEAFNNAKVKAFASLKTKFFYGQSDINLNEIIGQGPVLLPEEIDHNEVLFHPQRFLLEDGVVEDLSSSQCLTNIKKILTPFTGRNKELYEISHKLSEKTKFIEVTGSEGVGKTMFALQAGYNAVRNGLFSDGVFYIPLKKVIENIDAKYQVKDLLKEIFGVEPIKEVIQGFFRNKKMLLIFDNFELYKSDLIEFPPHFLMTLREQEISTVIMTNKSGPNVTKEIEEKLRKNLTQKRSKQTCEEIFGEAYQMNLKRFPEKELALIVESLVDSKQCKDLLENLSESPIVKQANGSAKYIVEKLLKGEFKMNKNTTLQVDGVYLEDLQFEMGYFDPENHVGMMPLMGSIARNRSNILDPEQSSMGRGVSRSPGKIPGRKETNKKRENKRLRKQSQGTMEEVDEEEDDYDDEYRE